MSERPIRPDFPEYELRPEYFSGRNAEFHEPAIEAIEDLIQYQPGMISYTASEEAVRREVELFYSNYEQQEEDEIIFSDFSRLQVLRAPVSTEVHAVFEEYRHGSLRRMASLALKEFVADSIYPFITEYHLESYAGGGAQTLLTTTDVIRGQGVEARRMVPYDFKQLLYRVDETARAIEVATELRVSDGKEGV